MTIIYVGKLLSWQSILISFCQQMDHTYGCCLIMFQLPHKANDEPRNPHLLPRKLSTVTGKRCGGMGHNMRSCKGKKAADRAMPKGGNKVMKP